MLFLYSHAFRRRSQSCKHKIFIQVHSYVANLLALDKAVLVSDVLSEAEIIASGTQPKPDECEEDDDTLACCD